MADEINAWLADNGEMIVDTNTPDVEWDNDWNENVLLYLDCCHPQNCKVTFTATNEVGCSVSASAIVAFLPAEITVDTPPSDLPTIDKMEQDGLITTIDMEQMYLDHVEENFDLELIRNSGVNLAYDAMYGAGQNVIKRLFPDAHLLHCDMNPSFMGQAPEPIHRNLE